MYKVHVHVPPTTDPKAYVKSHLMHVYMAINFSNLLDKKKAAPSSEVSPYKYMDSTQSCC